MKELSLYIKESILDPEEELINKDFCEPIRKWYVDTVKKMSIRYDASTYKICVLIDMFAYDFNVNLKTVVRSLYEDDCNIIEITYKEFKYRIDVINDNNNGKLHFKHIYVYIPKHGNTFKDGDLTNNRLNQIASYDNIDDFVEFLINLYFK